MQSVRDLRGVALLLMASIYGLNFIDRTLVSLFLEDIKRDLVLTDTELGLITGIAFATFYAVAGIPLSKWADRGNRVAIASGAIGFWGLTVIACSLVVNFPQLLAVRILAAIGEAGVKPPAYSMIGDIYPGPRERVWAMTIFLLGPPIMSLVGFGLGGMLGETYGWRTAFFFLGIPGLVFAPIYAFAVREPRAREPGWFERAPQPSIARTLRGAWTRKTSRHILVAVSLLYVIGTGIIPWQAAFLVRAHGFRTGELGAWLGIIYGVSGVVGVLTGGMLGGLLPQDPKMQMRLSALCTALTVPLLILFLLVESSYLALALICPMIIAINIFVSPTYTIIQRIVEDNTRATILSVVMLSANLVGAGLGPFVIGMLSDIFSADDGSRGLRLAMLSIAPIGIWSAYHFWLAGESVRLDLKD